MWGFAGVLYSAVFLGVWRYLGLEGGAWWHLPVATAAAGAFVAAFYSAKRAAIVGAVAGTVSSQAALIYFPFEDGPGKLITATVVTGLVFGFVAAFFYERRRGSLAVVVVGGVAGAIAGLALSGLVWFLPEPPWTMVMTFLLVPVTGSMFYLSALSAEQNRSVYFLPHALSVALAATWVSLIVGSSMWFLALSLSYDLEPVAKAALEAAFDEFPAALLGGVLGGASAGAAMELLNVRWVSRM
ncbi:MAG: hypothetical protein U5S82_05215 [Gammaproteobacteria bacterium]|nr:hypothetical protein [Gammaproteobacteria bacterium]